LDAFSSGRSRVPGATDVAACGIHVDDLDGRPFRSTPMRTSTRTARLRHALSLVEPQQEQAIARMQIAIKVDSRPPRAMGARLSSRLRWWRRLEEGKSPGLAVVVTRWRG
jgi:hypothetical protein